MARWIAQEDFDRPITCHDGLWPSPRTLSPGYQRSDTHKTLAEAALINDIANCHDFIRACCHPPTRRWPKSLSTSKSSSTSDWAYLPNGCGVAAKTRAVRIKARRALSAERSP